MIFIILVFLLAFLAWCFLGAVQRPRNFPPGPSGLPIVGNALRLGKSNYKTVLALREKYGDIIGLRMGTKWFVYLINPDDAREAFRKPEFSGRTGYNVLMDTTAEELNSGLSFGYGKKWVDHRRFTLRTLRDFGFAKTASEGIIMNEIHEFLPRLKDMAGKPISTQHIFNTSTLNVIWSLVAGERYAHDDPQMKDLMRMFSDYFDSLMKGFRPVYFAFPGLLRFKNIISFVTLDKSDQFRTRLFEFFGKIIDQHRSTIQIGQPRNLIDALLEESSKSSDFQEIDLYTTLMDLFVGGTETVSTTLVWAFFLLGQHPEAQEKLANEIRKVVGNREVTLSDKLSLPYVEATILEIMRMSHIAPFGTPHAVTEDLVFKGFFFPRNTIVVSNIYWSLTSEEIWGDPKIFRPERFLTPDGKSVVRNSAWIPFGVGKRACLGESLARDEMFLFLANIFQHVRVSMPHDEPLHSFEGVLNGGTMTPEPHRIVVNIRI